MRRFFTIRVLLAGLMAGILCGAASAQTTAQGTINATLVNMNGIAIVFYSDSAGVTLGGSSSAATMNLGTISAVGPLSPGVTRTSSSSSQFTVASPFYLSVIGGNFSASYQLTAQLAAAAPTGISCSLGAIPLSTTAQTLTTSGTYNTNVVYNMNLTVSTAAPGSGGPATGTPITTTIQFTATAN
jgi:hypothetical protein